MTHVLFVDVDERVLRGIRRTMRTTHPDWEMSFVEDSEAALDHLEKTGAATGIVRHTTRQVERSRAYRGLMSATHVVKNHVDGSVLTVWVVPGARRTEIVGYHGDAIRIRVAAPPEKGMANKAVARLLGDTLQAKVRLVSGAGSRRKRFVAVAVTPQDLVARLESLLD